MSAMVNPLVNYRRQAQVQGMPQQPPGPPGDPAGYGPDDTGALAVTSPYGNPSSNLPNLNLDPNAPIHNMFYDDQGRIQAGQNQINQEATSQLNYYGPMQDAYRQKADTEAGKLATTPGYTPGEAGQINVDYSKFNTPDAAWNKQFQTGDEQARIAGDPNAARDTMAAGVAGEGAMLNQYQANLGGEYGNYEQNLSGQLDNYGNALNPAVSGLKSGLSGAQGKFSGLDAAVNDPRLAFDPNGTEKQLTDADVQQMKTAAGTRIGNQYRTAEDTLNRNALEAGNTSPLAIAAANARLQTQEASDQGDAETNADIAARQAQYERAAGIEGQRAGETQTQARMRAGASTTEEAAAQEAARTGGEAGIQAAETLGQAGVNAANTIGQAGLNVASDYGKFSTQTAGDIANKQYGATATADQLAAQRAQQIANARTGTQAQVNAGMYGQGVGSQQNTAAGATNTGQARIAGQTQYRNYLTGQQGQAQQGGENAMNQQQQAFATGSGATNQSTAARTGYENSGPGALGKAGGQLLGTFGPAAASALFDKGGIVDKPTLAVIGERHPEMVIPITDYRKHDRERMAA